MLVLTRKPNETIRIGDDIAITFLNNHGYSIRLGIDAPKAIPVHREEIYQKIKSKAEKNA